MAPPPPAIEHSESPSTASLIDVDSDSVHTVPSDFQQQKVQTETQAERLEQEAKAEAARAEREFAKKEQQAKEKAKKASHKIKANSDNPVFIGNAVAVVGLSGLLGFGGYRKYAAGDLTWKVVAAWTGVVGLFAAGDYYLSQ